MRAIWKFPLQGPGPLTILMPIGAEVVHVEVQNNVPTLWALVDPQVATEPRRFAGLMTGQYVDEETDPFRYIGTALMNGGSFVVHIIESLAPVERTAKP